MLSGMGVRAISCLLIFLFELFLSFLHSFSPPFFVLFFERYKAGVPSQEALVLGPKLDYRASLKRRDIGEGTSNLPFKRLTGS